MAEHGPIPRYRLGRFTVLPGERRVLADDGSEAALGSRAFDLLLALIEHHDRVVAKDELLALVWPGVVVEENNLTVQVSALRKLLGAQAVRTVSGRGYQLGLPVQALAEPAQTTPAAQAPPDAAAVTTQVANAAGATHAVDMGEGPALPLPDKPSIAVLPFSNLGGDPEQEYFSDGITQDLITELSRFRELFVIAGGSSFTYKGRGVNVRTVGRELGVRYVLEGSIRRAGPRVRVAAQLVEAASGSHIWAERYDRELADIFAVQEEVAQAIVGAMAPQIEVAEMARSVRPGNLTAYELAMRARALLQPWSLDPTAHARLDEGWKLAREALALDPGCTAAWCAIADARGRRLATGGFTPSDPAIDEGLEACRCAIALDPNDHLAHRSAGFLSLFLGQGEKALSDLSRAVELNPNDALSLAFLAFAEASCGLVEPSIEHARHALRLSPRDPWRGILLNVCGWAHCLAGDWAEGARWARQAIAALPKLPNCRHCLIVCLVGQGEFDEARASVEELGRLAPDYVAARLAGHTMFVKPEIRRLSTTSLRIAAGLEAAEGLR